MKLSKEYVQELKTLAGIVSDRLYLMSFDRGKNKDSELTRRKVMEFILSNEDGVVLKCPVESTIIFSSSKDYPYWLKKGNESELLNGIHYILVEIAPPVKNLEDIEELFSFGNLELKQGCIDVANEVKKTLVDGGSYKDAL
jgi:hypothetical protein